MPVAHLRALSAITICVAFAATFCGSRAFPQSASYSEAEFTGVDQFWRVVATLQRDVDPAPTAWDSLFATPGYAALATCERARPSLTMAFRAAFMPSRHRERDSLLARGGYLAAVIRHVSTLPAERGALAQFRSRLSSDGGRRALLRTASVRAQGVLPPGTTERFTPPRVAFVFYLPDGHADTDLVVIDMAHLVAQGDPVPTLAHEFIHTYRNRLYHQRRAHAAGATLDEGEEAVLTLLDRIENESIADQSDKAPFLDMDSAAFASASVDPETRASLVSYRAEFRMAAGYVRALDGILSLAADSAGAPQWVKRRVDSLAKMLPMGGTMAGRATGALMVRTIRSGLGPKPWPRRSAIPSASPSHTSVQPLQQAHPHCRPAP